MEAPSLLWTSIHNLTVYLQKIGLLVVAGGEVSPPACLAIVICFHYLFTLLATFGEPSLAVHTLLSKGEGVGPEGPQGDS